MANNLRSTFFVLSSVLMLSACDTTASMAQVVIVERAMPKPMVEVIPVAPSPTMHWVPGHWVWRGLEWFWVRGHFVEGAVPPMPALIVEQQPPQPSPRHFWVRGYWAWEEGHWVWHRGVWIVS